PPWSIILSISSSPTVKWKCFLVLLLIAFSRSLSSDGLGETELAGETVADGLARAAWAAAVGDCPTTFQARTVKQIQIKKRVLIAFIDCEMTRGGGLDSSF